jgi:hypothetical protein
LILPWTGAAAALLLYGLSPPSPPPPPLSSNAKGKASMRTPAPGDERRDKGMQ